MAILTHGLSRNILADLPTFGDIPVIFCFYFQFNSTVAGEHTMYNFNALKFFETCALQFNIWSILVNVQFTLETMCFMQVLDAEFY